jgi:hypothetical protein
MKFHDSDLVDGTKVDPPHDDASQKKVTLVANSNIIELSDEDDPIADLEHDKFNLANHIPNEEVMQAMEERSNVGDSLSKTEEQRERDFVRRKYESYWEQKEEKC